MNIEIISTLTANALVAVPIIIAITQAIKLTGWTQDHFAPLLSIGVGIFISLLSDWDTTRIGTTILTGAIYGLMASGLYSGVKTTMQAHTRIKQQKEMDKRLKNFEKKNRN